jgi:hypothetical protein
MNTPTKAMTLAVAIAAAGALIWFAGRFDGPTAHDYWISLGLIAAAGLIVGVALRAHAAQAASPTVTLVSLLVTTWVAIANQPTHGHVTNWSHDLGIGGVVSDLGVHISVLAFGACVVVATAAALPRRSRASVPAVDGEPVAPEREREREAEPEQTLRTVP